MGTVRMGPPDDIRNDAKAVIVDRGSEAESYWRDRGYVTEEEVAGTGPMRTLRVEPGRIEPLNQAQVEPGPDDAMKVRMEREKEGAEEESRLEKGEGAPGAVGPTLGISPLKLTPAIEEHEAEVLAEAERIKQTQESSTQERGRATPRMPVLQTVEARDVKAGTESRTTETTKDTATRKAESEKATTRKG